MTPFLSAFTGALREFLWQGAAVAGLLWMVLLLLRNRPAQSRYAASCAALGILAVLPAVTAFGRYHGGAAEVLVTMPSSPVWAAVAGIDRPAIGWRAIAEAWTLPLWSLGVAVFSLRMVWACRQVAGFRRRGTPVEEPLLAGLCAKLGIRRAVRVMVSESADGPAVVGWMRPVILLPAAALTGMPADYLEAVLAHELAHVRRHDYLVNLLQMAVETLLFYHPAVWWVSARIRHERELCCDDLAADAAGRLCYARALTAIEKLRV
jgi:beta-lactamase regulating signal transducer with metallopeptidase domain